MPGIAAGSPPAAAVLSSICGKATVESTARPSAPPTCCEVLISPLASPARWSFTPETAAIVCGTNAKPRPTAARSDGPRTSPRKVPSGGDLAEPDQAGGDQCHPGREDRLVADPGDQGGGDSRGDDDRHRQRQVREPGLDRAVAQHVLHVQRDEEEHAEQRCSGQDPDHVRSGERAVAEDRERHQRRGRAQLDRDEGGEQGDRSRRAGRSSGPSPSRRPAPRSARRRAAKGRR